MVLFEEKMNNIQTKVKRDVLTPKEVSEKLGISINSTYRLIKSGVFEVKKFGTDYRIPKVGFYRWLNA